MEPKLVKTCMFSIPVFNSFSTAIARDSMDKTHPFYVTFIYYPASFYPKSPLKGKKLPNLVSGEFFQAM